MADTRIQLEVEDWVRDQWMPKRFEQRFYRSRLSLTSGGVFDFDAVSEDRKMAACISTSGGKTARGKHAVGKLLKLRSDMLFLVLAREPERRFIILTERDMYDVCLKEKKSGRVPQNIQFELAEIPEELSCGVSCGLVGSDQDKSLSLWDNSEKERLFLGLEWQF